MSFEDRLKRLPLLGLGLSTEFGAMRAQNSLDLFNVLDTLPQCAELLEVGIEASKGVDEDAVQWVSRGGKTTYHFLDINLDEPEDFDSFWLAQTREIITQIRPAWLCGDAGLWHHGPRAEGHMLLLPPLLTRDSAYALADGIIRLREETGLEVLPENPPGHVYLGPLHLLDFYAIVLDRADTGMLLDAAHLAIYQDHQGEAMTTGLDDFPVERIVELHMAGGAKRTSQGLTYIEDDHNPVVLSETWEIFHAIAHRLHELRAVIFECERNPLERCEAEMLKLRETLDDRLPSTSIWQSARKGAL